MKNESDTQRLQAISAAAYQEERSAVQSLLCELSRFETHMPAIRKRAEHLITILREKGSGSGVEAFLHSYGLDTEEGIAVMCLAEALLRIPDSETADKLIEDTFSEKHWETHLGQSDSLFVNASTWGLLLTGKIINLDHYDQPSRVGKVLRGLIKSSGEPVIREALKKAMDLMGDQFVLGETIEEAIRRARWPEKKGYTLSYDILGEGARTDQQAQRFFDSYRHAIGKVGASSKHTTLQTRPGISVKLSALDPRYHWLHRERCHEKLLPRLRALMEAAMQEGISISLDAEECHRLDLQLELFAALLPEAARQGYDGLGFVCQAYQKRALPVIEWLAEKASAQQTRIPVRLVKGAYWDNEIKWAQMAGTPDYPVFTHKHHTDVCYLACASRLFDHHDRLYAQFATHNALTVASLVEAGNGKEFEFQRLYGMGQRLYEQVIGDHPCRIYAPVGGHEDLLAYLIRRLLENGANTSFVNLLRNRERSLELLLEDPIAKTKQHADTIQPAFPLPPELYQPDRRNSQGIEFGHRVSVETLAQAIEAGSARLPDRPKDTAEAAIPEHYTKATSIFKGWQATQVETRAVILEQAADLLESRRGYFMALCNEEGKKTYSDSLAEVREAADFLRYYAARARELFAPITLPGPTGENNQLTAHGRGVFVCISPWNFPLAIFTGQVAAALVCGNSVLAKPAEQAPTIAQAMTDLLHEAGIPEDALQCLYGPGETIGAALIRHPDCAGVAFTGSTQAARHIQRGLADKAGPIVPFIAETGGQNAMMVDSSALLEHATDDIIQSAFGSAGQRCSALRVLYVQEEIADELIAMIRGAMDALSICSPQDWRCDVGPVIDESAREALNRHIDRMKGEALNWYAAPVPDSIKAADSFVVPHLFEISSISQLESEQFGPVLHVIRFDDADMDAVINAIHSTGYGLTFGLHSRILQTQDTLLPKIRAGNRYVNRNMVGATVGVQPFGGEGLSGTGPKAGGPHYLQRFVCERTTTINTTAIGGNLELLRGGLIKPAQP